MAGAEAGRGLWLKVFTVYQKDPNLLREWVTVIKRDVRSALELARGLVSYEAVPDTVTLGFSPQILVAVAAVNYPYPVKVVTSPEVVEGRVPAASFSHEVLEALKDAGLVKGVWSAPMAPRPGLPPRKVIELVRGAIEEAGPKILDISGGTQLAAIAAALTGVPLTYTYPLGNRVMIFLISRRD